MSEVIVLASASPQRKSLLAGLGLSFDVVPSAVDESSCTEADPGTRAVLLARLKAEDVAAVSKNAWIIGCDTLVVSAGGTLLEKPRDADDARRMLSLQSGSTSVVHSGLCVLSPDGRRAEGLSSSDVTFHALSEAEIDAWIDRGMWKDRSGAFQIDGIGQYLIEQIRGDWTSIVGFPVFLFGELMEQLGGAGMLRR